jgi:ribosome maturation factor RimP
VPIDGNKKNFVGVLRGLDGGDVLFERDGVVLKIAFSNIEKARLDPEL